MVLLLLLLLLLLLFILIIIKYLYKNNIEYLTNTSSSLIINSLKLDPKQRYILLYNNTYLNVDTSSNLILSEYNNNIDCNVYLSTTENNFILNNTDILAFNNKDLIFKIIGPPPYNDNYIYFTDSNILFINNNNFIQYLSLNENGNLYFSPDINKGIRWSIYVCNK